MGNSLSILIVEDSANDAALMVRHLQKEGFDVLHKRVESAEQMRAALRPRVWDAVLSDFNLPGFGAAPALALLQESGLDLPFILVSGIVGEEAAVELMKSGAHDYVMKDHMARLGAVIRREIAEAHERQARRQAESALRESEDRYRDLVENSQDLICTHDLEGRLLTVNAAAARLTGYPREALLTMHMSNLLAQGAQAGFAAYLAELRAKGKAQGLLKIRTAQGETRWWEFDNSLRTEGVAAPVVRGLARDITERKRTQDALRESEERFRSLSEMSSDFYWETDAEHRLAQRDSAGGKSSSIAAFNSGAQIGKRRWELANVSPDAAGWAAHKVVLDAHQPFRNFELSRQGADGSERFILISGDPVFDAAGAFKGYRGVGSDITERKRQERTLAESEARFRGLVEQSLVGIFITDGARALYINPRSEEILGYLPGELADAQLMPFIADADRPAAQREIGRLLSGETRVAKLEVRARRKDCSEVIVGAQGLRADFDGRPAIIGVMQDISEKKRAEDEIKRHVAELESAFMSTVEVTMNLGEMHDPYTAGHERRVAEIAVALGAELGLDVRRQEGLRVAGHLHDIGKIVVPAEILSKPGKLSSIEYQLVQAHAQASREVLKNVKFPWPVAEIALKHHERMDGSGYPRGHKGEAILLEARIIAVADVVEAMSSHRPYRAGLGIEAALAEIERGHGSAYDPAVADACLKLFREKGYAIPA